MTQRMRKWIPLFLCWIALAAYAARTVRVFRAERLVATRAPRALERAVRLVPDNAAFLRLLALEQILTEQNYDAGIHTLQRALALEPLNAPAWLDLASAFQTQGDLRSQAAATQAAVEAEPNNAETLAEAGEFELTAGDVAAALPLFRRSLECNPQNAATLISLSWRATGDVSLLFDRMLPANPEVQFALLRLLAEQQKPAEADQAWHRIVRTRQPFVERQAFPYLDYLIRDRSALRLDRAWDELADSQPGLRPYLRSDNRIVNPGFELPVLNGGLDWRVQAAEDVDAVLDGSVAHSGKYSLRISYPGKVAYDAGWTEFIPVHPGSDYQLSAWVKTEGLRSASGPRLTVSDAYSGTGLGSTEDSLDSHDWQLVQATIRVPFETQLVQLRIIRSPADTAIRGRIWIDDLKLVRR